MLLYLQGQRQSGGGSGGGRVLIGLFKKLISSRLSRSREPIPTYRPRPRMALTRRCWRAPDTSVNVLPPSELLCDIVKSLIAEEIVPLPPHPFRAGKHKRGKGAKSILCLWNYWQPSMALIADASLEAR
jgi:hypothetical protein